MSSATAGAVEYTAEVFIGGRFERPDSDWLPVLDKAAGAAFARYGNASAAQVDRAVATARQAQPAWADTDANTRSAVLRAFAAELERRHDELITLIIRETGGTAEKAEEEQRMKEEADSKEEEKAQQRIPASSTSIDHVHSLSPSTLSRRFLPLAVCSISPFAPSRHLLPLTIHSAL